jgi:hypothetical protein
VLKTPLGNVITHADYHALLSPVYSCSEAMQGQGLESLNTKFGEKMEKKQRFRTSVGSYRVDVGVHGPCLCCEELQ